MSMSPTVTSKDVAANFFNRYITYLKTKSAQNPNLTKSLILHFILVVMVSGLLPTCSRKIETPKVISIEIMPMGEAKDTAPKPPVATPEVKKDLPPVDQPKPLPPKDQTRQEETTKMEKAEKPAPVAEQEVKKPTPKKIDKKPEPKKEVKKQDEQKKDEKDQEGKKKLLKDLEKKDQAKLDNIFDSAAQDNPVTPPKVEASGKSDSLDPALVNEIMGKIQKQVIDKWNIPIGVRDVQNTTVELYITLNPQGTVLDVKIMDNLRYNTDQAYRVIADSAVWAVREASPFQGLPPDKFNSWKEIEFTFDPSKAL